MGARADTPPESETRTADVDGGDSDAGLLSKRGLVLFVGIVVGVSLGGALAGPDPLTGIGVRALCAFAIVLTLDRILGISRQWVPRERRLGRAS